LGILFVIDSGATCGGAFLIQSARNSVAIGFDALSSMSVTDVDNKICCMPDGDSTYTLKNTLGSVRTFTLIFMGQ